MRLKQIIKFKYSDYRELSYYLFIKNKLSKYNRFKDVVGEILVMMKTNDV